MRLQRCFSVRGNINGLLDVARRTYCEIINDIELHVADLAEHHGVNLRVGYNAQRGYHIQACRIMSQLKLYLLKVQFNVQKF